jgi:hypothetical protein
MGRRLAFDSPRRDSEEREEKTDKTEMILLDVKFPHPRLEDVMARRTIVVEYASLDTV